MFFSSRARPHSHRHGVTRELHLAKVPVSAEKQERSKEVEEVKRTVIIIMDLHNKQSKDVRSS